MPEIVVPELWTPELLKIPAKTLLKTRLVYASLMLLKSPWNGSSNRSFYPYSDMHQSADYQGLLFFYNLYWWDLESLVGLKSEVATDLLFCMVICTVQLSTYYRQKGKKCWPGTWFYPSIHLLLTGLQMLIFHKLV